MSDIQGAKAISLASSGGIKEDPVARVFHATGSEGDVYTVVLGSRGDVCTCPAGRRDVACYHVEAARLLLKRTLDVARHQIAQIAVVRALRKAD